jgi:protein tyrosine/serine phosphatase
LAATVSGVRDNTENGLGVENKGTMKIAVAVVLLMLPHWLSLTPAQHVTPPNIKNFGKVNENYYRGAQPNRAQLGVLKLLGVKTIVNLRRDADLHECQWAKELGLKYFNLPLKSHQHATEEQTKLFLRLVDDPTNFPVFVHCRGGQHRTGAMTAVYRITHDGWSAEQAFEEMQKYDFDDEGRGGPAAQKKFVFEFYQKWKQ